MADRKRPTGRKAHESTVARKFGTRRTMGQMPKKTGKQATSGKRVHVVRLLGEGTDERKQERRKEKRPMTNRRRPQTGGGGDPDIMGVKRPRGLPKGIRRKVM